ncbi:MAG: glycosyltransferase [Thermoanaerobacteraceae bacterium]|nr:glycosyltransferase [Thermoanaerobacteraceae bacterium]
MKTIIYPPTIDYNWLYQRPQQLLRQFAKMGYKIYFCNISFNENYAYGVIQLERNFYLLNGVDINYVKLNETPILWISYPPNYNYIRRFGKKFVIFDSIDYPSEEFSGWMTNFNLLQRESDLIFSTSKKLYEMHKIINKNVFMLPNGADFEHFNRAKEKFSEKPKDLPKNNKPIIGYFGALASWLDWELIDYITKKNPAYNFVFIGPLYNHVKNMPERSNIYYIGRKEYSLLPMYLQYFDVCIIPFKITTMTEGCDPIKMYEYLSAGKPVVSTNMPEVARYKEILVAENKFDFNMMLRIALEDTNREKREMYIKIAYENSWSKRAEYANRVLHFIINNFSKEV